MKTSNYFNTTKKASRGRWYYEFTHFSGSNRHLAGFCLGQCIYVYANSLTNDLCIHMPENSDVSVKEGLSNYQRLYLSNFVVAHTVGLSFDTYSRIFSLYYKDQVKRFTFQSNKSGDKAQPSFFEANTANCKDKISVNFGEKQFQYEIPFGYLPWKSSFPRVTCIQRSTQKMCDRIIYILLLSER